MSEKSTATYLVEGMTCEHCAASVREEVGAVAGVDAVAVDLAGKRVEVSGKGFGEERVRAAVEAAGYRIAGDA